MIGRSGESSVGGTRSRSRSATLAPDEYTYSEQYRTLLTGGAAPVDRTGRRGVGARCGLRRWVRTAGWVAMRVVAAAAGVRAADARIVRLELRGQVAAIAGVAVAAALGDARPSATAGRRRCRRRCTGNRLPGSSLPFDRTSMSRMSRLAGDDASPRSAISSRSGTCESASATASPDARNRSSSPVVRRLASVASRKARSSPAWTACDAIHISLGWSISRLATAASRTWCSSCAALRSSEGSGRKDKGGRYSIPRRSSEYPCNPAATPHLRSGPPTLSTRRPR